MTGITPLLTARRGRRPSRSRTGAEALFDELARLGAQVWMTGADPAAFADIGASRGEIFDVESGPMRPAAPDGTRVDRVGPNGAENQGLAGPEIGRRIALLQTPSESAFPATLKKALKNSYLFSNFVDSDFALGATAPFMAQIDAISASYCAADSGHPRRPHMTEPARQTHRRHLSIPFRPSMVPSRSRSSRASTRSASGRACISATPMTAPACITWSTKSSTTPIDEALAGHARRGVGDAQRRRVLSPSATTAAAFPSTSTRAKASRRPRSS
jgi:hypothetical protein